MPNIGGDLVDVQFDETGHMRFAIEAAGIGTWEWDFDRDVILCSQSCARLLGSPHGESIGFKAFISFLHPDDRETYSRGIPVAKATGILDVEVPRCSRRRPGTMAACQRFGFL